MGKHEPRRKLDEQLQSLRARLTKSNISIYTTSYNVPDYGTNYLDALALHTNCEVCNGYRQNLQKTVLILKNWQ